MQIAITDPGAGEENRVVEHRAVAIRHSLQLVEEVGEHLDVIGVDLRERLELIRVVLVVRDRVVSARYANFRIRTSGDLLADHERPDSREVGLKR